MGIAWVTKVGSVLLCVGIGAVGCGGDDSSSGGSAGAGGTSTGAGGSGTGGAATSGPTGSGGTMGSGGTTGSGGTMGTGGTGGNGCPGMQPPAGEGCNVDHTCTYGSANCDCVAGMWTCTGGGVDGGSAGCPAMSPDPFEMCTVEGKVCIYDSGHTTCTCSVMDGWTCTSMKGGAKVPHP